MVNCTGNYDHANSGEEQYAEGAIYTYGHEEPESSTGITQGGMPIILLSRKIKLSKYPER